MSWYENVEIGIVVPTWKDYTRSTLYKVLPLGWMLGKRKNIKKHIKSGFWQNIDASIQIIPRFG